MENKLTLITGGARSGKTSYAQLQALSLSDNPVYIATAKTYPNDAEFQKRIDRHISDRDHRWTNIEEQLYISRQPLAGKVVLVDCVTLWLTNFFSLHQMDVEASLQSLRNEINSIKEIGARFFIVTNELGMGIHAETETGRKFTDLQGWANQYIAGKADEVVFMVSGIPLMIKQ